MISGKHANQIYFKLFVNFHLTFLSMRWHFILILKMYPPCVLKICESSYSVIQFSSVAQLYPTLCNPMDCNWVLFLLWLCPFILSGVVSPLISSSILDGQNLKHWQHKMLMRMWSNGNTHSLLVRMQMVQSSWKTVLQFLTKLHMLLPHDPAIILFGVYSKKLKIHVYRKACPQIIIAAWFIIAKTWKQLRCPSVVG